MNLFENENKVKGTFLAINNIKRFKFVQIMFDSCQVDSSHKVKERK